MQDDSTSFDGIAIIGMAGRFPGAKNVAEFWRNLTGGVESITRFAPEELEVRDRSIAKEPNYISARAIIDGVDQFDPAFFGILPQDAKLIDPQHRIFLECCWDAMEDAGLDLTRCSNSVGVFAGCSPNSYFLTQVCQNREFAQDFAGAYQVGFYPTTLGMIADTLSTRVSYKLDLRGPSVTLLSACSTSLVAVSQAYSSLLMHQCDMALAGGVSITLPQKRGYLHESGGMVSPDGHCRAFDADAQGTVFGSGAGVVLLKRLADAITDGDPIYAVIKGAAINNDGAAKVGFTAPSVEGQAGVIAMAQAEAGFDPRTIGYIEAHGTGTPLGDPIEVAALTQVFRAATQDRNFCAIGTAKTNVGHLDIAAGVTGLIKTALSLKHRLLPPTLHFRRPNPRLDLENSPFWVNTELLPWKSTDGLPLRAGVSAFGVGGTNAHVVLEEAPEQSTTSSRDRQLLVLSAKSPTALGAAAQNLADHLQNNAGLDLSDVAYTLQTGRKIFDHRMSVVCSDTENAIRALRDAQTSRTPASGANPKVHFLFPGQGSQHVNMGRGLYETEPVFREQVDRCADILRPHLDVDLREIMFRPEPTEADENRLSQTQFAQPAIFTVEYSLARLWMSWGIQPAGMLGHSVGEFVAACLADVLSLKDALQLIALRGRLMQGLPGGAMLSVRLAESEVRPLLNGTLSIAAVNAPQLVVVSGPHADVDALARTLEKRGTPVRPLHTSHAFHSAMMDPILGAFQEAFSQIRLSAPKLPYLSCVTGTWITDAEATDAGYWARHFRQPVRFSEAVSVLRNDPENVLLEVGPGNVLQALARQHALPKGSPDQVVVSSLPDAAGAGGRSDADVLLSAAGSLWKAGVALDWTSFYAREKRQKVPLPSYPFERKRYWIESAEYETKSRIETQNQVDLEGLPDSGPTNTEEVDLPTPTAPDRRSRIIHRLTEILSELSGLDSTALDPRTSFLELGFDSLFLTQVTQALQSEFKQKITFRQLLDQLSSIDALASFLDGSLPADVFAPPRVEPNPAAPPAVLTPRLVSPQEGIRAGSSIEAVMAQQLQAMSDLIAKQLEFLRVPAASTVEQAVPVVPSPAPVVKPQTPAPEAGSEFKSFGPFRPIQKGAAGGLDPHQQSYLDALIARCTERTKESKRITQQYRRALADPRVASGFRLQWKEMVYPIVVNRSQGSRLWDVDGNEYVDLVNGFGPIAFGHRPDFVVEAVTRQLEQGIEIGPMTPLAGEVAELLCEITGMERATFCNTGSEAVMAAVRLARTVTGRSKVVYFTGDYHGNYDEVLAKRVGSVSQPRSMPLAPGVPKESLQNMIVLDYGSKESLAYIREHAGTLAAVLVEPVQSRHPELQPREFLKELRTITAEAGTALIFDEIVTGFRVHLGGAQAYYGIRADLATYGKVLGGGLPIGAIAGSAAFMDALDGGDWSYGDDSVPEAGVTFFAGTFVRHPLAMAAAKAILTKLKEEGPTLQQILSERTANLVRRLNDIFLRQGLPTRAETCGSMFYFGFPAEFRFGSLLYYHLRENGIHIQEGFPCFITSAHSHADLEHIVDAFEKSASAMRAGGVLPETLATEVSAPPPVEEPVIVGDAGEAPITESQLEILLSAQLGPEANCSYNEAFTVSLRGSLNEAALQESVSTVINRHEILRATFDFENGLVHFAPRAEVVVEFVDLSRTSDPAQELNELVKEDARTPFDLDRGPVVRVKLLRLASEHHTLLFSSHHIVCDGWSANVILDELGALYTARCRGQKAALPVPLRFRDYASSLQNELQSPAHATVESYWLKQFKTLPPLLDLPLDRPRPAVKGFSGATLRHVLNASTYQAIKRAGASRGCTLFVTLLSGFQVLMARLTGQDDLVVGIPTAGQSLLEGQTLVGHCVNFLPVRGNLPVDAAFSKVLGESKTTLLDAYEHQKYTFGTLVRKLGVPRDPSRLPLIEVQFNLERVGGKTEFHNLDAEVDSCPKEFVNFDLFLNVMESSAGLVIDCDYNTGLFDSATIERWLTHYETVLQSIATGLENPIGKLEILNAAQRERLLVDWNRTAMAYPKERLVHQLIEDRAEQNPGQIAVIYGAHTLTYAELNRRAEDLANILRQRGLGPNRMAAVFIRRSADMLVSVLAVLKAGGAYLPLDPLYPKERISFILEESQPVVILTETELARELGALEGRALCVDCGWASGPELASTPIPPVTSKDLAYVIYTSGSTGKPKGVEIQHRALSNFLESMRREPGFSAQDKLLAVTTLSFDIAGLELFLPLVTGGTVVIAGEDDTADGWRLATLIREHQVTVMQATPGTWRLLLETDWKPSASLKMLCGGEALPRDLADQLLVGQAELWNMYGPTETTIWSAVGRVEADGRPVRVGPPIGNTQFYVVTSTQQPVPLGVPGELCIGGDGLARGYFKRPELTIEKFVPNLIDPAVSPRLYRTGDLVRSMPDGTLEFLGRLDHQVKIRGFRVELGEIETAIAKLPAIREVVVVVQEASGAKHLAAYYAVQGVVPSSQDLRTALSESLPPYMIPSFFIPLEAIPRTPNGKVDRRALPEPDLQSLRQSTPSRRPKTAQEEILADICAEVLGLNEIGVDDNLFELGGDSILIFKIVARANRAGIPITARQVLASPTVEGMSVAVQAQPVSKDQARTSRIVPVARAAYRVTPKEQPSRAS